MKLFIKFDFNTVCNRVLTEQLDALNLKYNILSFGEVEFSETLNNEKIQNLTHHLSIYGIEIVENQKSILVEKIKDTIRDMIFNDNTLVNVKSSVYLAEALEHSYGYLSNLFSEVTYTSIEHYTILQKIEYVKSLIVKGELSLTEIAFKLNYSSVAHLSGQFKKTTGITPSAFQRIITKRKEFLAN